MMRSMAAAEPAHATRPQPVRLRWWQVRWKVLAWLPLLYLGMLLALMFFEESMIFFPTPYPDGNWDTAGTTVEDAWFQAADGVRLHGWFFPHEQPRAVVLFAHGNAGNLTHRRFHMRRLQQLGVSVLIFDYRGYGRSQGRPDEPGILADARAARKWLAEKCGIAETQIVLQGESLGGGVMVDLAVSDGARGLVLENTFTSLPDVGAYHYPALPVRFFMRNRLDSLSKIAAYHGPLLQVHGDADRVIPFALGQRLFDAANEPKQFVRLRDHDHNDPLPEEYYQALEAFYGGL